MKQNKQLVIIPTTDESSLLIKALTNQNNHILKGNLTIKKTLLRSDKLWESQHLYLLSDEEIKEGDWVVHNNKVFHYHHNGGHNSKGIEILAFDSNKNGWWMQLEHCKKIIATTDESLQYVSNNGASAYLMLRFNESFLPIYAKAYNEGNPITEVSVEYEFKNTLEHQGYKKGELHIYKDVKDIPLKFQLKLIDNKVIIHQEDEHSEIMAKHEDVLKAIDSSKEKMYSREEVEAKIVEGMRVMNTHIIKTTTMRGQDAKQFAKKWVKENLIK